MKPFEHPPSGADALPEALKREIAEFRRSFAQKRLTAADAMRRTQLLDDASYGDVIVETHLIESRTDEELLPELFNNFYGHFPGGMYRTDYTDEQYEPVHQALDKLIAERGLGDAVAKIVRRDPSMDKAARNSVLTDLYLAMRERGFSRKDLTG